MGCLTTDGITATCRGSPGFHSLAFTRCLPDDVDAIGSLAFAIGLLAFDDVDAIGSLAFTRCSPDDVDAVDVRWRL